MSRNRLALHSEIWEKQREKENIPISPLSDSGLVYFASCQINIGQFYYIIPHTSLTHTISFSDVSTIKKTSTDGHSLKWIFISLHFLKSLHLRGKIYILVVHYRLHHTCVRAFSGVFEHTVYVHSIFLNACIALSSLSLSAILPPPWVTH